MAGQQVNNFNNYGYLDVKILSKWAELNHYVSADQYNKLKQDIINAAAARGINLSKHLYTGNDPNGTVDIDIICPNIVSGQEVSVQDLVKLRSLTKNLVLYITGVEDDLDNGGKKLKLINGKPDSSYNFLNESNISKPLAALYNEVRQVVVDMKNGAPCVECSTACRTGCGQTCYSSCFIQCGSDNCKNACGGTSACSNSCVTTCHNETCASECEATCGNGACKQRCSAACGRDACGVNACTITCGQTCAGSCVNDCKATCGFSDCSSTCKGSVTGVTACSTGAGNCGNNCYGTNCGGSCSGSCVVECANVTCKSQASINGDSSGTDYANGNSCATCTNSDCTALCKNGGCSSNCSLTDCKQYCVESCTLSGGSCGSICSSSNCVHGICSNASCKNECKSKCAYYCASSGCTTTCNNSNCSAGCSGSCTACTGGCSGSGSSGVCGGGCSGACSSGTSGSASCSGGCSSGSGSSLCSTGCNTSCKNASCGSSCSANCTGDSCKTTCRSTCVDAGCINTCSSNGCSTECSGACGNAADCSNISCGGSCTEAKCANTCSTECIDTACKFGCGSACVGTCDNSCYSECSSEACKNKCQTSCLGSCKNDGCAWTCSVGCSNTCYDACGTSCINNCNDTCVSACMFGCESGCKGMTTKVATFKDKVFDINSKAEPPRTLGEKFARDTDDYGPKAEGKDGYDPSFPNTPYDNDFATAPGALNDAPYTSENRERKYNGEFDGSGTIVKTPKAFEFGKESILNKNEYVPVPEDFEYDESITYYTRSGSGVNGDPYVYTEYNYENDPAATKAEAFYAALGSRGKGTVRNITLYMLKREYKERVMIINGGTSSITSTDAIPIDSGRVRAPDTFHESGGTMVVAMDGKALIKVAAGEAFVESNEYYIKGSNGKFTRAPVNIAGYGGTWSGFAGYRDAGTLYKAGANIANSSTDSNSTTYETLPVNNTDLTPNFQYEYGTCLLKEVSSDQPIVVPKNTSFMYVITSQMDPDSDIEYIPDTDNVFIECGYVSNIGITYLPYETLTLQEFYNKYTITGSPRYSSTLIN